MLPHEDCYGFLIGSLGRVDKRRVSHIIDDIDGSVVS
jgi:hypothetical protein